MDRTHIQMSVWILTYLVNLQHFYDIARILRSSVSKQFFVTKTKLNTGKRAFSVAAPTIWNRLTIIFYLN